MALRREPRAPRADVRYLYGTYLADEQNDAWRTYLFLDVPVRAPRSFRQEEPMRDGDPLRIDLPPAVAAVLDALAATEMRRSWSAAASVTWCAARRRPTGTWPPRHLPRRWRADFRAPPGRTLSAR